MAKSRCSVFYAKLFLLQPRFSVQGVEKDIRCQGQARPVSWCLLCSLHVVVPSSLYVTCTPLMSAPQQLSPDGDTPWADHKGTLGRSMRSSCTPFTLAANLRDQAILEWFRVLKARQGIKESMFCFPSISRGQLQKFFYCTAVQRQNKNYMRTTTLDKALPRWSQQNYASPLY